MDAGGLATPFNKKGGFHCFNLTDFQENAD